MIGTLAQFLKNNLDLCNLLGLMFFTLEGFTFRERWTNSY